MTDVTTTRWQRAEFIIDWVLRVVGVLSFIAVAILYVDVRNRGDCQADVNEAVTQRARNLDADLAAERAAERRADDALTNLVTALISTPPAPPSQRYKLFQDLSVALVFQHDARVQADKARAANPPVQDSAKSC